jgi:hypothetical protein
METVSGTAEILVAGRSRNVQIGATPNERVTKAHFQSDDVRLEPGRDHSPNGHVQEVVRQAHEELRQLFQRRAEVMRRIGTIKQTIAGLANLFGDNVLSDELLELIDRKSSGRQPGFTKACRMILMDADRALSARDVCQRIHERMPLLLDRHKDPMASVTTVLNRLVAYGEAKAVALDNGRRAWQWVADLEPADGHADLTEENAVPATR